MTTTIDGWTYTDVDLASVHVNPDGSIGLVCMSNPDIAQRMAAIDAGGDPGSVTPDEGQLTLLRLSPSLAKTIGAELTGRSSDDDS